MSGSLVEKTRPINDAHVTLAQLVSRQYNEGHSAEGESSCAI
jgi:hypothetical protein